MIWLEAFKLNPPDASKALLYKAVSKVPNSVKLWKILAEQEDIIEIKEKIYIKAL